MRKSALAVTTATFMSLMMMLLVLGGCGAPRVGSGDYEASTVRRSQNVLFGTVESIRTVRISDDSHTNEAVGAVTGGVIGNVLGGMVGSGRGATLARLGGTVAGAAAGYAGGKAMGTQAGYEIVVKLDNGKNVVVTQGADIQFNVGQRVKYIFGGGAPDRIAP